LSPAAAWKGNFRDLNAAVARMATLSLGGRISVEIVQEETARLTDSWADPAGKEAKGELLDFLDRNASLKWTCSIERNWVMCLRYVFKADRCPRPDELCIARHAVVRLPQMTLIGCGSTGHVSEWNGRRYPGHYDFRRSK
jgi:hypothetical protein